MNQTPPRPAFWHLVAVPIACLLALAACSEPAPPEDPDARHAGTDRVDESMPSETAELQLAEAITMLHSGIDVSGHSGVVDWVEVAGQGHGFAVVKATEGVDLLDPSFEHHWREIRRVGLVRGAYHFYVTEDDPLEQAEWFIRNVELRPADLAPVVDIELIGHGTTEGWQEQLLVFVRRLHEHYGVLPILYTSPNFWERNLAREVGDELLEYPLWVAEYGTDQPTTPRPWPDWHLWQWRGDADVAGVEKGADLSKVNPALDVARLLVPHPASAVESKAGEPET